MDYSRYFELVDKEWIGQGYITLDIAPQVYRGCAIVKDDPLCFHSKDEVDEYFDLDEECRRESIQEYADLDPNQKDMFDDSYDDMDDMD